MESGTLDSKESLRLRMRGLRASLGAEATLALGREIAKRLFQTTPLEQFTSVALYASVQNEVPTNEIFNRLRKNNCRTFFPRVVGGGVQFVEVGEWASLIPGRWGVPEPYEGEGVVLGDLEAVLIPGLAFDESGGRLGFGKGYFDRALGPYRGCKIGLAYDFQVLPAIPRMESDLVCNWIVTDRRTIRGAEREESSWNPNRS